MKFIHKVIVLARIAARQGLKLDQREKLRNSRINTRKWENTARHAASRAWVLYEKNQWLTKELQALQADFEDARQDFIRVNECFAEDLKELKRLKRYVEELEAEKHRLLCENEDYEVDYDSFVEKINVLQTAVRDIQTALESVEEYV